MRKTTPLFALMVPSLASAASLDVCSTCTYTSIGKAVSAASSGDTINVKAGSYRDRQVSITKNLTITGAGSGSTTDDLTDDEYLLKVSSSAVVKITGISFTNSDGNDAHGLEVSGASLTMDDVVVDGFENSGDSTGTYNGAGLYASSSSTLSISNSTFENNISDFGSGGGLYASGGTITLSNVVFDSNQGAPDYQANGGGMYAYNLTLSMTGVSFDSNTCTYSGGGLATYASTVTSTGTTYTNNQSNSGGGGLTVQGSGSYTGTADDFDNNQSDSRSWGGGGVFLGDQGNATSATLSLSGATFTNNAATADTSSRGGGIFATSTGSLTLSDTTFDSNQASKDGGALSIVPTSGTPAISITNSAFDNNTESEEGGGALFENGGSLTLTGTDFTGNTAVSGGAIYLTSVSNLTATSDMFCANSASSSGGAAYLASVGSGGTYTVKNDVFAENSASSHGGGAYLSGSATASIYNNTWVGNGASSSGGAVYFGGSPITFVNNAVGWTSTGDGLSTSSSAVTTKLTYNAWYSNTASDTSLTLDSTNVTGSDFDLTTWSADGDCSNDAFWPMYGSVLINAGDTTLSDPDGSRSDIGAYGGPSADAALFYDVDGDGYILMYDCDDASAAVHPAATEVCDGLDNDCDGTVDGATATDAVTYYRDFDGDGYGNASSTSRGCSAPSGYVLDTTDCNDANAAINPAASEICNSVDDNCDGVIDPATSADAKTWYLDADGDGYGDPTHTIASCSAPAGYASAGTDCNDTTASISPAAAEVCNGLDDNCDGFVDVDPTSGGTTYYRDTDGDGFGDPSSSIVSCSLPSGYVAAGTDCDDSRSVVHPGAPEVCNGIDDDCDGVIDPATSTDAATWTYDADGDGYGDPAKSVTACTQPSGYVALGGDCDDTSASYHPGAAESCTDPTDFNCDGSVGSADADADGVQACEDCNDADASVKPGAVETCNGYDDNCNGVVDEATAADAKLWFDDTDRDGYGDAKVNVAACDQPNGYVADDTDCDDTSSLFHPGALESCTDLVDYNCDGSVGYDDKDKDGVPACQDCNDSNAVVYPSADEVCDGVDNDCNGQIDEDGLDFGEIWYLDADGDGHGDPGQSTRACAAPDGYVDSADDCDDSDAKVNPAAAEIWYDGVDENCDNADDYDQDVDGYDALQARNGDDCDDTDPSVNPAAADTSADGVDQNCDGTDGNGIDGGDSGIVAKPGGCGCDSAPDGGSGLAALAGLLGLVGLRRRR